MTQRQARTRQTNFLLLFLLTAAGFFACSRGESGTSGGNEGDGDGDRSEGGAVGDGDGDPSTGGAVGDGDGDLPSGGDGGAEGSPGGATSMGGKPDPGPKFNVAFISPEAFSGDLGGLAKADEMCAGWATDAALEGSFVALLSTSSVNASSRLAGARGWIRPDGRPLADQPEEFFAGAMLAPINVTASGKHLGAVSIWSGSNTAGEYTTAASSDACADWSTNDAAARAAHGLADSTAAWLYRGGTNFCNVEMHFYCVQADYNEPLDPANYSEEGRRIFVSTKTFGLDEGLKGADALCADDSDNFLEAGAKFRALLPGYDDENELYFSAASRFSPDARPIVRIDGLRVADDFNQLVGGDLIHPPAVTASGEAYTWRVITGATGPEAVPTKSSSCSGWTAVAADGIPDQGFATGTVSGTPSERSWFGLASSGTCVDRDKQLPVYCLEE